MLIVGDKGNIESSRHRGRQYKCKNKLLCKVIIPCSSNFRWLQATSCCSFSNIDQDFICFYLIILNLFFYLSQICLCCVKLLCSVNIMISLFPLYWCMMALIALLVSIMFIGNNNRCNMTSKLWWTPSSNLCKTWT